MNKKDPDTKNINTFTKNALKYKKIHTYMQKIKKKKFLN